MGLAVRIHCDTLRVRSARYRRLLGSPDASPASRPAILLQELITTNTTGVPPFTIHWMDTSCSMDQNLTSLRIGLTGRIRSTRYLRPRRSSRMCFLQSSAASITGARYQERGAGQEFWSEELPRIDQEAEEAEGEGKKVVQGADDEAGVFLRAGLARRSRHATGFGSRLFFRRGRPSPSINDGWH